MYVFIKNPLLLFSNTASLTARNVTLHFLPAIPYTAEIRLSVGGYAL